MKFYWPLFYFALTDSFFVNSLTIDDPSNECKDIAAKSVMLRLKKNLFCNYVWSDSDDKDNTTYVVLEILPQFATMDEYYSNLELYTWMFITWKDEHLKWDPSLYGNIRHLKVYSNEIWVPEIAVQSPGNDNVEDGLANGQCEVSFDGRVGCAPRHRQTIKCQTDFTLWPFDRQNCTLVISSLAHIGRQIAFTTANKLNQTVFMHELVNSGQWQISVSRIAYERMMTNSLENFTLPKLSVDFILDRIHSQLNGRYVTPGIVMMVMTLTTLWLNPRSTERLTVACLNPIIHLLCIHDLNWILPHNGNTVPNIVLFYINSFGLAIVALLLTFFLGYLLEIKTSPPKWISSSITSMLASKIGQLWLLSVLDPSSSANVEGSTEDNSNLVNSESEKPIWSYVVVFLTRISFLFFIFIYLFMWTIFIPNSSMKIPIIDIS